jgi:hypothetical protein
VKFYSCVLGPISSSHIFYSCLTSSTKQSSHTNQCHSLHKFFIYTIWILDLLCYIPPKMLLCGLRHEPPILDGDGDIVSNLKSTSMFERFPCFRWFNWKDIQIKRNHVRYSERYLIATSFPRFHFREAP